MALKLQVGGGEGLVTLKLQVRGEDSDTQTAGKRRG